VSESAISQRLAAILAADVVGYSRLMAADEHATVRALDAARALFREHIEGDSGRVVDMAGDSVLAVFPSAAAAVRAAVAAQEAIEAIGVGEAEDRRMRFRVGVNLGEIIEKSDGSIYGDGVNIAARLESLAEPGGVTLSAKVHDEVAGRVGIAFALAGEHKVKNIERPVRTYRVVADGEAAPEQAAPLALPDKPSIVVLPFENMSGDAEQEYFSDGISEDIITDISKISGMFVIARNSAFVYKGKAVNLTDVGRELGVRYVLEGSVRKAGNRIRVTAQLIDCNSGGHLWAERYDRNLDDIFAVQDELTREIVKALEVHLSPDEQTRLVGRPTGNMEAYDLFLRARDLAWQHRQEPNAQAQPLLERVIALDPDFADAVAILSFTHVLDFVNAWSDMPERSLETAYALACRAVSLDDGRPWPHFVMAIVHIWRREHEESLAETDRCQALDPNFPHSWSMRGHALYYMGRGGEGIEDMHRAIRLDPLHPDVFLHFLGQCHFGMGDYEQAEAILRQRLMRNPGSDVSRVMLASALGHVGRAEEARAEWQRAISDNPNYSLAQKRRVLPYRDPAGFEQMVDGLRQAGIDVSEGAPGA